VKFFRSVFSVVAAVVLVLVSVYPAAAWNSSGSDGSYGASTFGGTSNDLGDGVAVDSSGNVYTTGRFAGTVNFGAGNVVSAGNYDVFVTKLNASGTHQWTTKLGGTGSDGGYEVAVDSSGNVYTTGYFNGTVNFGGTNVTSAGSTDVFVTKLNASGVHQWTTTFGGTGADYGYGVAVDSSGNVYTTGYFSGTVNFGAGNVVSAGILDVFVTKMNASGQLIVTLTEVFFSKGPCQWSTALHELLSACVEPVTGSMAVTADGTFSATGSLVAPTTDLGLADGETVTDLVVTPAATTRGYVLTSASRLIGFGNTTTASTTDLVTLKDNETVTTLATINGTAYFVTSQGRMFDMTGNIYVDLSAHTTSNVVDVVTTSTGGGIMITATGGVFSFGTDLFKGSLGGQGITDIVGAHIVQGGYYLIQSNGNVHTFGDVTKAKNITDLTKKVFNSDTLNSPIIDVDPSGTGFTALAADGGTFDLLGATHNPTLRTQTTAAIAIAIIN
jgi:hypothetical protein